MDLFGFFSLVLLTVLAVTLLWPLNIPLLALAIKVRRGPEPIGYEMSELWLRCTFGTLGLAMMALLIVGLTYGVVVELELDAARGPVHLIFLGIFIAAAIPYLYWMLALEDMVQAASIFLLYVFLPGLPLFLLGWLLGVGRRVADMAPWLL